MSRGVRILPRGAATGPRREVIWLDGKIAPHVAAFNALAATIEILIGIGLLHHRTARPALTTSFAWAGGIWLVGEGLGMLLAGTASPLTGAPGAALVYLLAGAMVWPGGQTRHPAPGGREFGLLGARGVRLIWGLMWLGFAALWLLPANSSPQSLHDSIARAPAGTGCRLRSLPRRRRQPDWGRSWRSSSRSSRA